ncbi:MAG TPA: type II toxin-antitoxin system RelE/ParE family toxin [Ruminococcus sp.]|nr:type II toxin-antitoxin system RelE/ParE family toxin [Ruminococcus sp.]
MQYEVKMTPSATEGIGDIISYISKVLLVPDTASKWADYLQKEIAGLNIMPARHVLVEMEPWRGRGIRKMPVKNFIVYYFIDEKSKTVWITAVVYAKRDQLSALKNMPL